MVAMRFDVYLQEDMKMYKYIHIYIYIDMLLQLYTNTSDGDLQSYVCGARASRFLS